MKSKKIEKIKQLLTNRSIVNVFCSRNLAIRIVWSLFFIASISICTILISGQVFDYLNYDVITRIDYIIEQAPRLPTLSFCTDFPGFSEPLDKLVIYCTVNNNSSCSLKPFSYFEQYNDIQYGVCYRFNSGRSMSNITTDITRQNKIGIEFGINLGFNITSSVNLYAFNHDYTLSTFNPRVYIPISSRSINYLKIDKTIRRKLPKPYNNCFKEANEFSGNKTVIYFLLKMNRSYSQRECFNLLYGLSYIENSGCHCGASYDLVTSKCLTSSLLDKKILYCSLNFTNYYLKLNKSDLYLKYCPAECDSINYQFIPFNYRLKTNIFSNRLNLSKQLKTLEQDSVFFYSVFYDKFEFMQISEQPKLLASDLIAKIGGLISLFIGISLLSFIKVIALIWEAILILIESKNKISVSQ